MGRWQTAAYPLLGSPGPAEEGFTVADRTKDKTKSVRPRAGSTASLEDETASEPGDLPEDDLTGEESDLASAPDDEADEPIAADRALVPEDEDEEDLRLPEAYVGGGAVSQTVARSSTRGLAVPRWMMGNAFTRFLAESYLELRKVTWPEPRVARNMTLIVIGMSVFVAVFLGLADYGLTQFVQWAISHAAPVVPGAAPTPTPPLVPGP
jgi:preprotein translocase SecE subunit